MGDTLHSSSAAAKAALRRSYRQRRAALSPRYRRLAAAKVAARLLAAPLARTARFWGLYLAVGAELDTSPLIQALLCSGRRVHVPVIGTGQRLIWVRLTRRTPLVKGPHGIRRPRRSLPRLPHARLQVLVVPLVAFDTRGTRLGAGGGYYDRLPERPHHRPLRLGYAFSEQRHPELPRDPWDVPLRAIATPRRPPWPTGS